MTACTGCDLPIDEHESELSCAVCGETLPGCCATWVAPGTYAHLWCEDGYENDYVAGSVDVVCLRTEREKRSDA